MSQSPSDRDDESFLDDVFDAVSIAESGGKTIELADWIGQRPHLAAQIEELVQLAGDVCPGTAPGRRPTIPGYELVREIGRGGMGSVFLARQQAMHDRFVALKVLPRGTALSEQARARFRSEARALARIRHPNVVAIYDVLDLDATPAYAMEWVDGQTLLEVVQRERQPAREVARFGLQVAAALTAAHTAGLLHRDVKPSNIMVRQDGTALLTDFGLVRDQDASLVTRTGAFLGTPAYAAPEQLRGEGVDERADVYGLGATMYHAASGRPPFEELQQPRVLRAIETGALRPLHRAARVDRDLATIIETAMEVEPSRRYADADALAADLQRFVDGRPIAARRAGFWLRARRYAGRNRSSLRGVVLGSLSAIVAAVLIVGHFVRQASLPERFAEHVRRARLVVLDPKFDERMAVMMHRKQRRRDLWDPDQLAGAREPMLADFERALAEFDAALGLLANGEVQAEREVLALARYLSVGADRRAAMPDELRRTAPTTLAFAKDWLEKGGEVPLDSFGLAAASRLDRRCLGLLAMLLSQDAICVRAWQGLDLATPAEPLIDAALGQLFRQRGESARAWPRLERAAAHFREAGFLDLAVAEVALECGDPAYTLRVLDRANEISAWAYDAETCVRAAALANLGRIDEARLLFERHAARGNVPPASHERLSRFFASQGEFERAMHHAWRLAVRWPTRANVADGVARILQEWWQTLSPSQRRAEVLGALPRPGSWLDQVAYSRSHGLTPIPELGPFDAVGLARWRSRGDGDDVVGDGLLRGRPLPVLSDETRVEWQPATRRFEAISIAPRRGFGECTVRSGLDLERRQRRRVRFDREQSGRRRTLRATRGAAVGVRPRSPRAGDPSAARRRSLASASGVAGWTVGGLLRAARQAVVLLLLRRRQWRRRALGARRRGCAGFAAVLERRRQSHRIRGCR